MTAGRSNKTTKLEYGVVANFTSQVLAQLPADILEALAAEPRLLRQWVDAASNILVADWTGYAALYSALIEVVPPGVRLTELTGRDCYAQFVWTVASARVVLKIVVGKGCITCRLAPFVGDVPLYQRGDGPVSRQLVYAVIDGWEMDLAKAVKTAFADLFVAI